MTSISEPWLLLLDWPLRSQQRARRNAMIAATAMAQRRAERRDVQEYLDRVAPPESPVGQREPAAARVI